MYSEDLATLYAVALEQAPARSSYIGAAIDGLAVGRVARAFAKRFGTRREEPQIVSIEAIATELDQRLSGARAQREPGWEPRYFDPEREIAMLS